MRMLLPKHMHHVYHVALYIPANTVSYCQIVPGPACCQPNIQICFHHYCSYSYFYSETLGSHPEIHWCQSVSQSVSQSARPLHLFQPLQLISDGQHDNPM